MADLSDAVDRETAWLLATGDTLPALLKTSGGPWDLIQAYWIRNPGQKKAVYVTRSPGGFTVKRTANQRQMGSHQIVLHLRWPIVSGSGRNEEDQRAFDVAIYQLVTRIAGLIGDKTHGARFLSAAEPDIRVDLDDAFQAMAAGQPLTGRVTYTVDDFETNN